MSLPDEAFWHALADAADRETMARFRQSGNVANKLEHGFDPVTEADREAERALRQLIAARHPDHAILGEEHGSANADHPMRWVIDPIDGTRAFVSGLPVWMTLVGLEREGQVVAGLASQPVTGERFIAPGDGTAHLVRHGERVPLRTSAVGDPAEATVMTTDPYLLREDIDRLDTFRREARLVRYGTDAYAFCALAAGQVDVVFERGVQPYDVSALIALVEGAGGVFSTWAGERAEPGGNVVAAATPALHDWAVAILSRGRNGV